MDSKTMIVLMFLGAALGVIFTVLGSYISRQRADDVAAAKFVATATAQLSGDRDRDRDRGIEDTKFVSPVSYIPGFRWRWENKFRRKQQEVKEMLVKNLKLLHVMSTIDYEGTEANEIVSSWKDISTYMEDNPIV
ncbi:hypothetical protein DRE_01299 [Drechslerella stenobrocha 248]|uniref:Uncharacterized protein n=1 Tax=Drechslerella stenobrocha 248 TaxID=1043628 RepID=W7HV53_9PEZI|nr:hypothetical protein DRE_01299 [Drechslerella stenobrocha 248]